jgi:hypothetical protein
MGRRAFKGRNVDILDVGVETNAGVDLFVDPQNGKLGARGTDWSQPFSTMAEAFDRLDSPKYFSAEFANNARIFVIGTITEQLSTPLDVFGVRIIGAAGGTPRHGTEGGVAISRFASYWTYPTAGSTNAALLTMKAKGWTVENMLMVPKNGYAAVRFHNADSLTVAMSGSNAVKRCKIIGPNGIAGAQGRGIEDHGGNHNYLVEDCQFMDLEYAIAAGVGAGDPGIAAPLRNTIRKNVFESNKNDIYMNASRCMILDNLFRTKYHAVNHPNTVNLAATQDMATGNSVIGNFFADATADVVIAKGYKPSTGDVWRNFVTDAADPVVAVPS